MSKRIVIIPDTQLPYDDRKSLKALIQFIGDVQPDEVIHIGDLLDLPQPSRWNKDTKGEFEGSVTKDADDAKRRLLTPLRDVYGGPVRVHEGNHDERARTYLAKYAPALADAGNAFRIDNLLDFDGFGVELLPDFYKVAPGWISTHGHKGQISLSRIAGNTATNAAVKMQASVVMGHTHRLAIGSHSVGVNQRVKNTFHGMEVGHLMDMKKAHYLNGGTGNWQQGFGLLTVEGQHVKPEIVPINKGKFTVDNYSWKV